MRSRPNEASEVGELDFELNSKLQVPLLEPSVQLPKVPAFYRQVLLINRKLTKCDRVVENPAKSRIRVKLKAPRSPYKKPLRTIEPIYKSIRQSERPNLGTYDHKLSAARLSPSRSKALTILRPESLPSLHYSNYNNSEIRLKSSQNLLMNANNSYSSFLREEKDNQRLNVLKNYK